MAALKLKYGTALQLLLERNKSATTLKDTGQYNMLNFKCNWTAMNIMVRSIVWTATVYKYQ